MKTLVIQSFRTRSVPAWIERCLDSAKRWAALRGYDYLCTDDRAFALCGDDYLARVNGNLRAPEISIERGVQFSGECTIESRAPDPGSASDATSLE